MKKIKVLVVGLGNMGLSHARAYKSIKGFEIAGLCSRGIETRDDIKKEFPGAPLFSDYAEALAATKPDAVSINTWPDTHAAYAKLALKAGCHIFIEKPLGRYRGRGRGDCETCQGLRQETGDRLYPAGSSLLGEVC